MNAVVAANQLGRRHREGRIKVSNTPFVRSMRVDTTGRITELMYLEIPPHRLYRGKRRQRGGFGA